MKPENRKHKKNPGGGRAAAGRVSPSWDAGEQDAAEAFSEKFRLTGIDISPEDIREIEILEQFLGRHVQPNRISDVQCMLLWNEWVRTFQRRTPGFPKRIHEKEFRNIVMETFGTDVAWAGFRGAVYPGIKFVP
jgi:hypothetical protein